MLYNNMRIYIASDHAGFSLKEEIKKFLNGLGVEVFDKGPRELNPDDDYPDFIAPVAREISKNPMTTRGIIIGGSGQGEAIVSNRFPYVRACVYYGGANEIIKLSREHNDANILSIGARFVSQEEAIGAVKLWLKTPFSKDERHVRRINKIEKLNDIKNGPNVCSV
jgi:ribose 5-phosphate isomerase B